MRKFLNLLLSVITLAFITPIHAYAHNLPDDHIETALMHPFVSPDHALTLIAVMVVAGGVYILRKRSSQ